MVFIVKQTLEIDCSISFSKNPDNRSPLTGSHLALRLVDSLLDKILVGIFFAVPEMFRDACTLEFENYARAVLAIVKDDIISR